MYIPEHFAETDPETIARFVEQYSFGMLISQVDELPFATHLPLILKRGSGSAGLGTLVGHMARANPHWQTLGTGTAMAVFAGPHAYISPTWYESKQVVPTWNYAAVHVYGTVQTIEDPEELLKIVQESVAIYERHYPTPWPFPDEPRMIERLLRQIVGLRMEIARVEAKFKMSQNHPPERREKVIRALRAQGGDESRAVAALVEARLAASS